MSTLSLWARRDPFADFDEAVNAIVRRTFVPSTRGFVPAADLDRDGDDAVLRLELPGLDAEKDVTVEVDKGRLTVKGERRSERNEENGGRSFREVRYGSFQRSFGLPEHVTGDAVTADYDAGVLTVRVAGAYATPESAKQRIAVSTAKAPSIEADDSEN